MTRMQLSDLTGTIDPEPAQPRILTRRQKKDPMSTRYDVSNVPPQGGYVAKQCPARAQYDALQPCEPLPTSAILQRRFDRGNAFEAEITAELLAAHPDAAVIPEGDPGAREAATLEAMRAGARLILNSRLPTDAAGRRVGKPDVLIAAAGGGYRPVDVKHHMALEDDGRLPGLVSTPAEPGYEDAGEQDGLAARRNPGDLLQLAHYQRMLEAIGFAAADGRIGGIIGVERQIVWYDLDAPIWQTPSSTGKQKKRTTMERYDFEFAFRLDIIAVAQQHLADPSRELLVVPFRSGECDECPWWTHCRPQLEAGAGDVSLIARMSWPQRTIYHTNGITDRAALAGLDARTAQLVSAGVDLPGAIEAARALPPETPLEEIPLLKRRRKQRALLEDAGIQNAAHLLELDESTARAGVKAIAEHVDQARAALGPAPVYRRRGVETITVPRADIEIDVDMESIEDGTYLWGALFVDRAADTATYHPFVDWEPYRAETELATFMRFWEWFNAARAAAHAAGKTFRAYCYSESAENQHLWRLGRAGGRYDEIRAFTDSDEWVDMHRVINEQLITGAGTGLKVVAPLAGYAWAVDEPGGGESMLRYDEAVLASEPAARETARAWLLRYNQGDVEATRALRDWLARAGRTIPSIEECAAGGGG